MWADKNTADSMKTPRTVMCQSFANLRDPKKQQLNIEHDLANANFTDGHFAIEDHLQ